jgi:hypothetical protein
MDPSASSHDAAGQGALRQNLRLSAYFSSNDTIAAAESMQKLRKIRALSVAAALAAGIAFSPAVAFHGGHTGVTEAQIRAACPAFSAGEAKLSDSISPPGNLPMTDVFEHETGARCSCSRMRTDKHTLKCGPAARRG